MSVLCDCRKVAARDWHNRELVFENRSFYVHRLPLFFHLPICLSRRIKKLKSEVAMKNYSIADPLMVIQKDGSLSGMVMLEIDPPRFFDPKIKTFDKNLFFSWISEEAPINLREELSEAKRIVQTNGQKIKDVYFWYTTCPKCKTINGNQTVILLQIS